VQRSGEPQIVDELAAPGEQPGILAAANPLSNHVCHGPAA
jgi:hypothetical protein